MQLDQLQSIEGHLQNLLDALHVKGTGHIITDDYDRRKKLLRMTITALQKLDRGEAVGGDIPDRPNYESGPGSPSNALSLNEPSCGYAGKDPMEDYLARFR
jgi:hypothetical protein